MPEVPKYGIGDTLYLRESAGVGFLESIRISGISLTTAGWVYSSSQRSSSPTVPATFGDRISFISGQIIYFGEDELIPHCAALAMMEDIVTKKLVAIQNQRSKYCP